MVTESAPLQSCDWHCIFDRSVLKLQMTVKRVNSNRTHIFPKSTLIQELTIWYIWTVNRWHFLFKFYSYNFYPNSEQIRTFDEYLPPWVLEILPMLKVISAVKLEYCCSYDSIRVPMIGKRPKINWIKSIICSVHSIPMSKMKTSGAIFSSGKQTGEFLVVNCIKVV